MSDTLRIKRLEAELDVTRQTLGALISWMAQSANSPIRVDEASKLLDMLAQSNIPKQGEL